jgi:anti-sigma regulatory factor (Ser/Thr protein kinase)
MPQLDRFIAEFVSKYGIADEEFHRILIVLEELLTNLMKYGYVDRSEPGRAEIALELAGDCLEIEFIDDGCPFDPFAASTPHFDEPVETRAPGGLGLYILRSMCDQMRYERRNDSNVLRLTRVIASRRPL